MQHRTETKVEPNGTIILRGLPFPAGDKVVVVITTDSAKNNQTPNYSLRGLPVKYQRPFDSVGENEWEALA